MRRRRSAPELGEADVKLVVRPQTGHMLGVATPHDYCVANLPAFKVPRYIEIVAELPRTPVGKIDKERLRKHIAAESPASGVRHASRHSNAPGRERITAAIDGRACPGGRTIGCQSGFMSI
jgi:crotonobetaine/carnitine-CoA ligase